MTIESSRQLLTAKDRIAARAEKAFKEAVSKDLPMQFNVMTFIHDSNPTQNASQGGKEIQEYGFCRARSQAGHHDMLRDPLEIRDSKEREAVIQSHFQAYYSLSDTDTPQNGDIWSAIQEGGVVRLISLVERTDGFRFQTDSNGGMGEARAAQKRGKKKQNVGASISEDDFEFVGPLPQGSSLDEANRKLLGFISSKEGSYNASNNGTDRNSKIRNSIAGDSWVKKNKVTSSKQSEDQKLLSTMTIGEIMNLQRGSNPYYYPNARNKRTLFAVGAYQIIPKTMPIALKDSDLSTSDVFTTENQDKLGLALIYGTKRPKLRDYLLGKDNVTLNEAHNDFAEEWASVPRPDGKTAYQGTGNKAGHTAKEVSDLLQEVRRLNIEGGRT